MFLACGVLALAVWARLAPWPTVFTAHGIELQPTDSHYYLRFAERLIHHFPRYDDFDPFVNPPGGATIYWPPWHAYSVAGLVALFGPLRGAAFVDPFLGVLELLALLLLARRRLGEGRAVLFAFCLALLPAVVDAQALGCADHHVHEPMFVAAVALLLAEALEGKRGAAIACGALIGVSRLFTTFTVALFVPVAGAIAIAGLADLLGRARTVHPERSGAESKGQDSPRALTAKIVDRPSRDERHSDPSTPRPRRYAQGERGAGLLSPESAGEAGLLVGVSAAGVLTISALIWGQLFSLEYTLLSGFLPLAALAAFLPAGGIGLLRARDRRAWLCLAGFVALAAIAVPALHAGAHLRREDPLLALVVESLPFPLTRSAGIDFFGAALVLAPFALFGALRRAREDTDALVAIVFCVLLFGLTLSQARFVRGFSGALCLLLALGLPHALPRQRRPRRLAGALVSLGVALLVLTPLRAQASFGDVWWRLRPTLAWMKANTPSPGDPYGDAPARYGVVANFNYGHLLTLFAERPAVATPFSQAPWHVAGNARASDVLAATDDETAFRAARETKARYVLATPFDAILGHPMTDDRKTLARRLLDGAGLEDGVGPASAHFRLIFDSAEQRERPEGGPLARLFEVVAGAELQGNAPPGAEVTAELRLADRGQILQYLRRTRADEKGRFALRVAYPTSDAAPVHAEGPYRLSWAGGGATAEVGLAAVESGGLIPISPAPGG